jgi:hypothetical protein
VKLARLAVAAVALAAAGCPAPYVPPIKSGATVKDHQLPNDVDKLVAYVDEETRKQTATAQENALVAVDKGLGPGMNPGARKYDLLWRGARACAWLTEEYTQKPRRAEYAKRGVEYAKGALAIDAGRVEAQYYLGINIGQLATTKTIGGYTLVPQVVKAAEAAMKADEKFDHAGPLRLLGSVYAKAPPWPASVGDVEEGLTHLQRAVQLAREYPQNHLLYADALLSDDKLDQAEREYCQVLTAPPVELWAHRLGEWRRQAEDGIRKIDKKLGRVSQSMCGQPIPGSAARAGSGPTNGPPPVRPKGEDASMNGTPSP